MKPIKKRAKRKDYVTTTYSAPQRFDEPKLKALGMTLIRERSRNITYFYFHESLRHRLSERV